jgi:hypothetical protein
MDVTPIEHKDLYAPDDEYRKNSVESNKQPKKCWFYYIMRPLLLVGHIGCLLYYHPNRLVRIITFGPFCLTVSVVAFNFSKIAYDIAMSPLALNTDRVHSAKYDCKMSNFRI